MNQLIREDNRFFDKTVLCTYDNSGNILTKKEYVHNPETPTELLSQKNYAYPSTGWKDKLSTVNNQPIIYDVLGNPLCYLGHSLTWDKVRQLKSFDNNTFSYNSEGIRTKKNDIDYIYHNGKLFIEQRGFDNRIIYYYDESGIAGFTLLTVNYDECGNFNGLDTSKYVFEKNLQGDVIGIYNDLGSLVAQYRYDAWGNCMITQNVGGMATFNAIRYRGYYYDTETGLYYLKSRYYDPNTGRFINADVYVSTGQGFFGCNMFTYCLNNPIMYSDKFGTYTYESLDFDDDGVIDCYVYTYYYSTKDWLFKKTTKKGKVYIYTNVYSEEEFYKLAKPDGFVEGVDLMVGDWTHHENATMFAFQAHKIDKKLYDKIIDILFEYVSDFGKEWKRTKASVKTEWINHKIYAFKSSRAQNVDFDENEEGEGFLHFFWKAVSAVLPW